MKDVYFDIVRCNTSFFQHCIRADQATLWLDFLLIHQSTQRSSSTLKLRVYEQCIFLYCALQHFLLLALGHIRAD